MTKDKIQTMNDFRTIAENTRNDFYKLILQNLTLHNAIGEDNAVELNNTNISTLDDDEFCGAYAEKIWLGEDGNAIVWTRFDYERGDGFDAEAVCALSMNAMYNILEELTAK